jgi:hypothetical protein
MLKHGGRLENYFSRRRVTHIICSNLPDSKIKNLRFILVFFFKLITLDFFFFFAWRNSILLLLFVIPIQIF